MEALQFLCKFMFSSWFFTTKPLQALFYCTIAPKPCFNNIFSV
jgi:hypothetical protein